MQAPQLMQRLSSMVASPVSGWILMASTGQLLRQGRIRSAMALYGHAWAHLPHSLHLAGSMCARSRPISMASKRHDCWQAFPIHFWQLSVTTNREIGQSSQAASMTCTILSDCLPSGGFPSASAIRCRITSRSLYTQQRNRAFGPGIISKGSSSFRSSSVPAKASFATSYSTSCLIFKIVASLLII